MSSKFNFTRDDLLNGRIALRFDNFIASELREIEDWCNETGCGRKVNYHKFAFKDEGELMMFTLRWK